MSVTLRVRESGYDLEGLYARLLAPKPGMRRIGNVLKKHTRRNMSGGMNYTGRKMSPAERWTRWATGRPERNPPLNVTGTLRDNHDILSLSGNRVAFGPNSKVRKRASLMHYGGKTRIPVEPSKIRTGRDGRKYVRVKTSSGDWITKRVKNGTVEAIVRPRKYFGLSNAMADDALAEFAGYLVDY